MMSQRNKPEVIIYTITIRSECIRQVNIATWFCFDIDAVVCRATEFICHLQAMITSSFYCRLRMLHLQVSEILFRTPFISKCLTCYIVGCLHLNKITRAKIGGSLCLNFCYRILMNYDGIVEGL